MLCLMFKWKGPEAIGAEILSYLYFLIVGI